VTLSGGSIPKFARGHRLREDKVRGRWVILAPERLFEPDDIAVEVLKLVDGARTLDAIVDALATTFDAPRDAIAADVTVMLAELQERQVIGA
jgi:pyrroloquinoline quinone biosynthesis protein D